MDPFKKITESIIILLFLSLICILPFFVADTFVNPSQTAKTFIFLYGLIIIGCGWTITHVLYKTINHTTVTTVDVACVILLGYICINRYLFSEVTGFSFGLYELVGLAFIYIFVRLFKKNFLSFILLATVLGGFFQAIYGNLQLYGIYNSLHSSFSITGSFFNPGPYAGYLVSALPVALGICLFRNRLGLDSWQEPKSLFKRKLFVGTGFVAAAAILLVLPASQSRAALLAATAGSGYLVFQRFGGAEFLSTYLKYTSKKRYCSFHSCRHPCRRHGSYLFP